MSATSMRDQMPETAKWVDARRAEFGVEHVKVCVQRAMRGEPGHFYAIEGGHVLGTPFPPTSDMAKWQDLALATGCKFAAFMAKPEGKRDGAD